MMAVRYKWLRAPRLERNPHIRHTEVLGSFSAGEIVLSAPVGGLASVWGGQFDSAASTENFSLEGTVASIRTNESWITTLVQRTDSQHFGELIVRFGRNTSPGNTL
jgi:hypothetical protein